ncbi:hypothetical protein DICVIV_04238 [Dictyocaulus viviparus]|uniref:Uncharacterized protein n=1 Tax=Dictyocaulus viviparus TaxID=29172 RepID=A0A0D8XY83_DICVI|nr:hypothetical protein DICVIV_04238 [Dictyocaulus viviparus]
MKPVMLRQFCDSWKGVEYKSQERNTLIKTYFTVRLEFQEMKLLLTFVVLMAFVLMTSGRKWGLPVLKKQFEGGVYSSSSDSNERWPKHRRPYGYGSAGYGSSHRSDGLPHGIKRPYGVYAVLFTYFNSDAIHKKHRSDADGEATLLLEVRFESKDGV